MKTIVRNNESFEDALRRFKNDVARSGTYLKLANVNIILNQVSLKMNTFQKKKTR